MRGSLVTVTQNRTYRFSSAHPRALSDRPRYCDICSIQQTTFGSARSASDAA